MQPLYYGDRPEFPVPKPHEHTALSTRPPTMPEVSIVSSSEFAPSFPSAPSDGQEPYEQNSPVVAFPSATAFRQPTLNVPEPIHYDRSSTPPGSGRSDGGHTYVPSHGACSDSGYSNGGYSQGGYSNNEAHHGGAHMSRPKGIQRHPTASRPVGPTAPPPPKPEAEDTGCCGCCIIM